MTAYEEQQEQVFFPLLGLFSNAALDDLVNVCAVVETIQAETMQAHAFTLHYVYTYYFRGSL